MIKILVDRTAPTSENIKKRENFDVVFYEATKNKSKKSYSWYYGAVGVASFVLAIITIFI